MSVMSVPMQPVVPHSGLPMKRKQEDETHDVAPLPETPQLKRKKTTEHVISGTYVKLDLQKRIITLNQEPQPLDKYTSYLSLMARFQEWLMDQPLDKDIPEIPREFWPLVGMIGHESTCLFKAKLAESIGNALKPEVADGEVAKISSIALNQVISQVLEQTPYGIHPSDIPITAESPNLSASPTNTNGTNGTANGATTSTTAKEPKIPASLACKRWEVKAWEMIPQSEAGRGFKARDVMQERKGFRELAREEVKTLVKGLEPDVLARLVGLEKDSGKTVNGKVEVKSENGKEADVKTENGTTILQAKPGKAKPQLTPEQIAEKQAKEVEKQAKEAEKKAREQEKARKQEVKTKKAQEVAKSKAMMATFFGKPKASAAPAATVVAAAGPSERRSSVGKEVEVQVARAKSRSESVDIELITTDFQTAFKPFYAKANVDVAPVNRFARQDVVVPDEDMEWQGIDLMEDFVKRAKMTRPVRPKALRKRSIVEESRSGLVHKPKTETLFCTIPDLVDRAQEAEDPRLVYSHLKDLEKFPRKTLKFEEDLRPPYSGTWTKSSWFVGPRTPFALDPNLDYSVDEGLDWEPENLEEGAMDVDEEEEPESEDDEDMGSWLASDDELDEPSDVTDDPFVTQDTLGMPAVKPKVRKETKLPPRRFEKLVQFQKGPVWENGLGEVAWKGFDQYRICVLNDTPLGGIDPFTWTPEPAPQPATATPKPTIVTPKPMTAASKPLSATSTPQPSSSLATDSTPKTLTPRPIPKAKFTAAELADFLCAIDGSDKTKKLLLVDLYARFKAAGSQASIKAKLEEVAIKAGTKGSVWSIKPAAWVEAGISPPTPKA